MKKGSAVPSESPRSKLSAALENPRGAFRYLNLWRRLRRELGLGANEIQNWRRTLIEEQRLPDRLLNAWTDRTGRSIGEYSGGSAVCPANEVLYVLVRAIKPRFVVETGVAAGFSTAYILQGLFDNETGILHSIDLPCTEPEGRLNSDGKREKVHVASIDETGFVIPQELRRNWVLHLGASRDVLPDVLEKLPQIDLFWHDSEHSYETMTWEFEAVWPHVSIGGILASDDVSWNSAFVDFVGQIHGTAFYWSWPPRGAVRRIDTTEPCVGTPR